MRGLIQQRLPGGLKHQHLVQRAVAVDRHQQAQLAVDFFATGLLGVIEVPHALDFLAPVFFVPGAFVAHGRGRAHAVDLRALGIQLLLVGQFGFEAGNLAGQLRAVERRNIGLGRRLSLGLLRLARGFFRFGRHGGHGCFGRGLGLLRLGGRGRGDLFDGVVLERRHFSGLGHGFFIQRAAALLIVLRQKVSFLRSFFALERREGNFQCFADWLGLAGAETHAHNHRDMQQGCDKQGKTQAISCAHAGVAQFRGQVAGECHGKKTNIAGFTGCA